jgi:eukaryotic-like serine/threonine-protein kinase
MNVSREQFERNLLESGLMSDADLASFRETLPAAKRFADAETLARELVQAKRLTKYQAARIYQDKPRHLRLGDYDVLQYIASGGMGRVYQARKRSLQKIVALKILHPHLIESEAAVSRFRREVKVAASLDHPNIVMALDADCEGDTQFMAMEFVAGRNLAELLKIRGPMSVEQAIDCTLQACQGLAYAHRAGVIHRDIKPANLMLDRSGRVKILDLGLALLADATDDSTELTLQKERKVTGTFDYMSPEQAVNSTAADQRSDIYSLGCTLYSLLTGKLPFGGESPLQKIASHKEAAIPALKAQRDDVPDWLDELYRSMMAKQPSDRPRDVQQVINLLLAKGNEAAPERQVHEDSALSMFFTDEQTAAVGINQQEPWIEQDPGQSPPNNQPWRAHESAKKVPQPPYQWPEIDISMGTLILFGICGVVGVGAIALLVAIIFA